MSNPPPPSLPQPQKPNVVVLGLRLGIRHGDRDDLGSGPTPHMLVTTPESLDVLLHHHDDAMKTVQAVVIDEVHLLYNTQRGLQLSLLLARLRQRVGGTLQWAALSATVGQLAYVRDFLFDPSEAAVFLQYPAGRSIDAHVRHITGPKDFFQLVRTLIEGRPTKLLVFANARRECERLADMLHHDERLRPSVFAHYSSLAPSVRVDTERAFASARTAVCIATSTLELGIDIGDIDAVILWGVPGTVESFLQRIGRGNRRSHKANVVCLIPDHSTSPTRDALRFLTLIGAARNGDLPVRAPYELFGAVGQQCLDVIASEQGRFIRIADLHRFVAHKKYLTRAVLEGILGELAARDFLQPHGFKNQYGGQDKLYQLVDYRLIYGNFPAGSQMVEVRQGESKVLGMVPALNLLRIRPRAIVRFGGRRWRVRTTSPDGIIVEPVQGGEAPIDFTYLATAPGFDAFLANRLWQALTDGNIDLMDVNASLRTQLTAVIAQLRNTCDAGTIPFVQTSAGIRYLTFAGRLINRAVALLTGQRDFQVDDNSLLVASPIQWEHIPDTPHAYVPIFDQLCEQSPEQSLYQTLLPQELQVRECLQEWLRDETVPHVLMRLAQATPRPLEQRTAEAIAGALEPSHSRAH